MNTNHVDKEWRYDKNQVNIKRRDLVKDVRGSYDKNSEEMLSGHILKVQNEDKSKDMLKTCWRIKKELIVKMIKKYDEALQ